MANPLSIDIRSRAMARLDAGATVREAAEALSVSPSSVVKWSQLRRVSGSVAPLRANKSETFDCLKFTLEGAGERSDGYARTSAHAFGLFA